MNGYRSGLFGRLLNEFARRFAGRNLSVKRPIVALALVAAALATSTPAWALDDAKTPKGANYAGIALTGDDVPVGVIEVGGNAAATRGIDTTKYHFAGRLIKDRFFNASSPPLAADPAANTGADSHATLVADVIASDQANFTGVAKEADIYAAAFGGASNGNALRAAVDWYGRQYSVGIFNHSYQNPGVPNVAPPGDIESGGLNNFSVYQRFLDWHGLTFDSLHVVSSGNSGRPAPNGNGGLLTPPGGLYNGITVGALDVNMTRRADYSDYRPAGDSAPNRPDIVAPGTNINSGTIQLSGTSFSAPMVSGALAVLSEAGLSPGGNDALKRNHLAAKAILLNPARKRGISLLNINNADIRDNAGTIGGAGNPDGDYLAADGLVRASSSSAAAPARSDWSPQAWTSDADGKLTVTMPLDDELGAGALDVKRMLKQFDGGEQARKELNAGGVSTIGWDRGAVANVDSIYEFNVGLRKGSFLTATLAWDRFVNETNAGTPGSASGQVDAGDTYAYSDIPNLDLAIFFKNTQYAISVANAASNMSLEGLNNIAHLHYPIPFRSDPMDWSIRVITHEPIVVGYGLAWWAVAVPEPGTGVILVLGIALIGLQRRMRPISGQLKNCPAPTGEKAFL